MMPHAIQHYQSCFRIDDPKAENFQLVQAILFDWLTGKEVDRAFCTDFHTFKFAGTWTNLFTTKSAIDTSTCLSDSGRSWALQFQEIDKEHGRLRYWYTEVGLRQLPGAVVLFARVSYAWNSNDLSNFQEVPGTSVPRFIKSILKSGAKIYCGRPEFRLASTPVVLRLQFGKGLADWILSPDRKHPLIVFNGNRTDVIAESESMARELVGKCQVLRIPENQELDEEIRCYLPREYAIQMNHFRVFFPVPRKEYKTLRHRWYDIRDDDYANQRRGIIAGLLRNYAVFDDDSVESIEDVRRRISQEKLLKFRRENPEKNKELEEFYQLLDETEKQRDEQKRIADFTAAECDSREDEIADLKRQMHILVEKAKTASVTKTRHDFVAKLNTLPTTLKQVVDAFSAIHGERLVFSPDAISTAEEYSEFGDINEAWEMFYDLTHTIYRMKFGESGGFRGDWEKEFRLNSRFELTMSETSATKKDSDLMAEREVVLDGKTYDVTPHLKWGRKEPKMLRLHFAFDEPSRKIVVGYVGPHMSTAGTRRLS